MQFRGSSVTHTQSTWRIPSADQLFIVWSIYWPLGKVVGIRSGGTNTQRFCQQPPSNPDSKHLDRHKPTVPFTVIQKLVLKDSSIRHLSYRPVSVITNRALELRWSICTSSSTARPAARGSGRCSASTTKCPEASSEIPCFDPFKKKGHQKSTVTQVFKSGCWIPLVLQVFYHEGLQLLRQMEASNFFLFLNSSTVVP